MQEGPDGNSNTSPTYWFYHPLVGHANASRIYKSWLHLTGHGETGMINVGADRTGRIPDAHAAVMAEAGKAIRDTFTTPVAAVGPIALNSSEHVVLQLPGKAFDYIETKEDLTKSQRIMNYSIEYRTAATAEWKTLVPAVHLHRGKEAGGTNAGGRLGDRPAGADPRDSHIGFRRIDVPLGGVPTADVTEIRFNCLRSLGDTFYLKSFAVFKANLPW